jgi:hypothetical protein
MRELIAEILAITNSRRIAAFLEGAYVDLPTGERTFVKVKSFHRSTRSEGLRFSKFSFASEVTAGEQVGFGYGEGESQLIAFQKSIVEGVERAIYKSQKAAGAGTLTSNGWAAHVNTAQAKQSALEELLERDSILVHWLCKLPFTEIDLSSCPTWLRKWAQEELALNPRFNRLRVAISNRGHLPTVLTALGDNKGHAILSHATSSSMERAIYKALAETCRIGQLATFRRFYDSSLQLSTTNSEVEAEFAPEDHAMVYAYHLKLPDWTFGETKSWRECHAQWNETYRAFDPDRISVKFHQVATGPLTIGYCTSTEVQNLYFGRTEQANSRGLINLRRLEGVRSGGEIFQLPHCVP